MKIRTITCHDCYNLGASLQAFALQHHLQGLGHDVRVIDYKPPYLSGHFRLSSVSNPRYGKPFLKQLYLLAKLPGRLLALRRKRAFDDFTRKHLQLTRRYSSYESLKADAPEADAYVAGSDQIWNTLFPNGRDAAFYLGFGRPGATRISYAASFATKDVLPGFRDFVQSELRHFDAVSIRERISLPLLRSLGRDDGVAVCDPVFLLSREEWTSLAAESGIRPKGSYVLVYLTDRSDEIRQIARCMKQATGWRIYVVGAFRQRWADRNFVNAGPSDFVKLVAEARYVVSNSFHATAFSLLFGKDFCVVNRKEGINERMKSVLADYGLEQRMVSRFSGSILDCIDYPAIRLRMQHNIENSKQWLKDALSCRTHD